MIVIIRAAKEPSTRPTEASESEKEEMMLRKFPFASVVPSSSTLNFVKKPPV